MKKCFVILFVALWCLTACNSVKPNTNEKSSPDTQYYSEKELQEISDYSGNKNQIMGQYSGGFLVKQNTCSTLSYANKDYSTVLVLYLDESDQKVFSAMYHPIHPWTVFEELEIGTSMEEVKEIDPYGGYLYGLGRMSISNHCTTDGYYISIEYSADGFLKEVKNQGYIFQRTDE